MLSMKFLYQFPLPKTNITFFLCGRERAGVKSTSPKFDLLFVMLLQSGGIRNHFIFLRKVNVTTPVI